MAAAFGGHGTDIQRGCGHGKGASYAI
jgi:hypothetical protein